MILESVENGPLIWPTIEENGLRADIYSLVNHHRVAKDLYERVQLLMQGTSLTKQERECKLYDAFDKFTYIKGETLHKYYLRFTQLINDMNIYNMRIVKFQVNTKFLNSLLPECSKFMTDVKLVKDLHTTNFDQLHAYLQIIGITYFNLCLMNTFNPPIFVVSPVPVVAAQRAVDLANSLVSMSIDQDAPSASIPSTQEQEHSPSISQDTPLVEKSKLDEDLQGKPVDATLYRGMIGSLMYLTSSRPDLTYAISQSPRGIFLNQSKYALEIIKKYGMETSDPVDTPMGKPVDATLYRGMIGSLMYLTSSRPDLTYAVCLCARYQAKPIEKHLNAVKRIFRYLKGTINMGLWYSKDISMSLTAYADADHAGCQDTRRSKSGSTQFLGDKLVSWSSKKQKSIAISSTKAEYISLSSAIALCCNNVQHSRTKHIDVHYHFIKEQVDNGIVELYFIRTEYQLFTKPLPRERFNFLIEKLGMRSMSPEMLKNLAEETDERWR
nr:retrovirus-related Pol polyprotein from transposon TNT 1-94 [Tanacetum cinerariifolium]